MNTIIIGNGPSAIEKENGDFINSFNIVIRINNFLINGYEKYVGTKTDIWSVNNGYIFTNDFKWKCSFAQPKTIIFVPYSLKEYQNYQDCQKVTLKNNEELCNIDVSKQADLYYDTTRKKWPSTGLMTIMQFNPCYITGFDSFQSTKHHYGDDEHIDIFHDGLFERNFINDLMLQDKVIRI